MTFNITVCVRTPDGLAGDPVEGMWIHANDMINGETFARFTDGVGYANVAMLGTCKAGDAASIVLMDPQLRYVGGATYHTLGEDDVTIELLVDPFG